MSRRGITYGAISPDSSREPRPLRRLRRAIATAAQRGSLRTAVLFAGALFGAYAAVVWITVAPWIPGRGRIRALANGVVAVALASFFVIRADEPDFRVLEPPGASVAMLVGLVADLGWSSRSLTTAFDAGSR